MNIADQIRLIHIEAMLEKEIKKVKEDRDEYKMQFLHADDMLSEAIKECERLKREIVELRTYENK